MHFDHAGVATDDAPGLASLFEELFDAPVAHEEELDDLSITFLELENGYFELLEPLPCASGAIQSYLDERGPGIHHLALATDDVASALESARDTGVELIDEEPRDGAWGHEIAFLHPRSTGGILIEFVER